MKRILFLDYDGVVNIPLWNLTEENKWECTYNWPRDNAVNSPAAVQWISAFCQKFGYSIVVSSSWRKDKNYKECLINAGLREGIEILGRTPILESGNRGEEISAWLASNHDIEQYIIVDDVEEGLEEYASKLVLTREDVGFMRADFIKAECVHYNFEI